jgi:hypothetical protein
MSIAKIHEDQAQAKGAEARAADLREAAQHIQDALRLFRKCVGSTHPLTANAIGSLGKVRILEGSLEQARPLLAEALGLEVSKDAFHVSTVFELIVLIKVRTGPTQTWPRTWCG